MRIVKDIKTKQFYALKIMKKARIVRMKQIGKCLCALIPLVIKYLDDTEHVLQEVTILANIRCSFIVELQAVFQDDNAMYLLTEFLAGGELFSHIRRNERLANDVAKFYVMEVASALQCLHRLNIAYRYSTVDALLVGCLFVLIC